MTRYSNDPRQITAKFSSSCSKCKTKIKKGVIIYYWPSSHEVFCTICGDIPYRQFLSSAADEDVYNGTGNLLMPGKLKEGEIPFLVVGRR